MRRRPCFASIDAANSVKKAADYSGVALWGLTPRRHLVHSTSGRAGSRSPRITQIRAVHGRWRLQGYPLRYVCAGKGGGGAQVVQNLFRDGVPAEALAETVDKVTNSTTARVQVQAGKVYFPDQADWLAEFKRELLQFPNGEHDDQVDLLSHAANQAFVAGVIVGAGHGVDTSSERIAPGGPRVAGPVRDLDHPHPLANRGTNWRRLYSD
jgi:predicted phage terminase large subunit-like protein